MEEPPSRRGIDSAAVAFSKPRRDPTPRARSIWPVGLCLLLVAEGLALGIAYDAVALRRIPPQWWTPLVRTAARSLQLAVAVATAGLLVVGPRISRHLSCAHPGVSRRALLLLLSHLASFALLFVVCGPLFNPKAPVPTHPGWLALACAGAAMLAGVTWVAAVLPPGVPRRLLRETGPLLLLSAAIGVAAWGLGQYTQHWWAALRSPTLRASTAVLRLWEPDASADPDDFTIEAGDFGVIIDRECSGYEGVGLVWVFLATYFWLFRAHLRFPQALLLVPLATAASWFANVVRIAVLVGIGARLSPAVAVGGFHSYAGTLLFCGVALGCVAVGHGSRFFMNRRWRAGAAAAEAGTFDGISEQSAAHNPAAPYLLPFLAAVATGLVTAALSTSDGSRLYGVRLLVAAAVLWHYRRDYRSFVLGVDRRGLAWAVGIGAAAAAAWLAIVLAWPGPEGPSRVGVPDLPAPWRAAWVAARTLGAVAMAPVVEELAFRGYLARRLMRVHFESVGLERLSPFAILVSSAVFAALHRQPLAGLAAGLAFAWAARRRGRLADAVVAHATTNALLVAYALPTGAWWVIG